MKKIKRVIYKHFNIVPWFIVGISVLLDGEVSKFQYAVCWFCTMLLIWHYVPNGRMKNTDKRNVSVYQKEDGKWELKAEGEIEA